MRAPLLPLRSIHHFYRWRCAPKHDGHTTDFGIDHGCVAHMHIGGVIVFKRRIVFFIDHNQTKLR
jgi:hypothetical protein